MPHIKKNLQSYSLQKHVLDAINSVIVYSGNQDDHMANGELSVDNSHNLFAKPAGCHLRIVDLQGVCKEKRRRNSKLNRQ